MTEVALWDSLRPTLQGLGLDPQRVENALGSGTPDVNYTHGWIELKDLPSPPRNPEAIVRVRKLEERPNQVAWMTRRWMAGGPAYLLLRLGSELLLFDGITSKAVRHGLSRADLRRAACWSSTGTPTAAERTRLKHWLTWDYDAMLPHDRAKWDRLVSIAYVPELLITLGWTIDQLLAAEAPGSDRTDDLLAYWES